MTLDRLNLLTALVSFTGGLAWLYFGEVLAGLIWVGISAVWLLLALRAVRKPEHEAHPFRRLGRRLSRLLMYGP